MNDVCEMWNLPWHALQRNLAMGIGGDAAGEPGNFTGSAFKAVATVAGNSWLGRARLHRPKGPLKETWQAGGFYTLP
jgi:hypothetical protein